MSPATDDRSRADPVVTFTASFPAAVRSRFISAIGAICGIVNVGVLCAIRGGIDIGAICAICGGIVIGVICAICRPT